MDSTPLIYDVDLEMLLSTIKAWGEPDYRALQTWQGLYRELWATTDEFTTLPRSIRRSLRDKFSFSHLKLQAIYQATDRMTSKALFSLPDGSAIETVLMVYPRRRTLCISTQAGCALGCEFCATGQMGFRRHLTSGEIVEQVIYFERMLASQGEGLSNVVLMGMGEPFHNYENTMAAIDRLNHPLGFNMGARRFTISTAGLVPAIRRFSEESRQVNLAVSLHAADDELRSRMMPINRKYPLNELFDACLEYINRSRRRISFEWALIREINDTAEQAYRLAGRLKPFFRDGSALCHVNVIPLNPTKGFAGQATTHKRALEFKSVLELHGIPCTIRLRRGIDIQAGCGQLASGR